MILQILPEQGVGAEPGQLAALPPAGAQGGQGPGHHPAAAGGPWSGQQPIRALHVSSLTNDNPQGVAQAVVTVRDEAGAVVGKAVTSSARGEYWKLLLPGKYTVRDK